MHSLYDDISVQLSQHEMSGGRGKRSQDAVGIYAFGSEFKVHIGTMDLTRGKQWLRVVNKRSIQETQYSFLFELAIIFNIPNTRPPPHATRINAFGSEVHIGTTDLKEEKKNNFNFKHSILETLHPFHFN